MSSQQAGMRSSRPYLVRALSEWILDNHTTPYVVVDAGMPGVHVPSDYVANGQIVLNISPSAVRGLSIQNDALQFSARFGGVPMQVYVPISAVLAIYAKENGQGMVFGQEPGSPGPDGPGRDDDESGSDDSPSDEGAARSGSKPNLKIVK
jgi:stringent starvation protein B